MDIILIFAISCMIASASGQWWLGGGSFLSTPKPLKRDCLWMEYSKYGGCINISDGIGGYAFMKKRQRQQIKARHGGAPCVGKDHEYARCSPADITGTVFLKTITAAFPTGGGGGGVGSGGGSSRRTLFKPAPPKVEPKKCVNKPLTDANGNILMSGNICSQNARRKREALAYTNFAASRTKRQAPSTKNRDVLFLLDESGSVEPHNFKERVVRLAKAVTKSFCGAIRIGKTTTRVGVMNFDESQYPEIDFDDYFSKAQLLEAMDTDIVYHQDSSGATCLVDALKFARTDMFQSARGARIGVNGTERIVILVTDGCANCKSNAQLKSDLAIAGKQFTEKDIPIITFLVTGNATYCFDIMQGLSDGSQCYQLFHAATWTEFDNIIKSIEDYGCIDTWYPIGPTC